jgi:hypothetical protein
MQSNTGAGFWGDWLCAARRCPAICNGRIVVKYLLNSYLHIDDRTFNPLVVGSNPTRPTSKFSGLTNQAVRVLLYGLHQGYILEQKGGI